MELFAIIFGGISGACLTIIALRKKLPLFGGIASTQARQNLDSKDKLLASCAGLAFLLFIVFLLLSF